jgi:hypothetical protein
MGVTMTELSRPAFYKSIIRLSCSACGAEANASCSCGKPYVPARERAAEAVAAHPDKSNRVIAEEIGVDEKTVRQARASTADQSAVEESRTGKDGRTRRLPSYIPDAERVRQKAGLLPPDPMQDEDIVDQIVTLFAQLTRTAQVRCAMKLRKIIRGEA